MTGKARSAAHAVRILSLARAPRAPAATLFAETAAVRVALELLPRASVHPTGCRRSADALGPTSLASLGLPPRRLPARTDLARVTRAAAATPTRSDRPHSCHPVGHKDAVV